LPWFFVLSISHWYGRKQEATGNLSPIKSIKKSYSYYNALFANSLLFAYNAKLSFCEDKRDAEKRKIVRLPEK
jgi:hypothetical protein